MTLFTEELAKGLGHWRMSLESVEKWCLRVLEIILSGNKRVHTLISVVFANQALRISFGISTAEKIVTTLQRVAHQSFH